MGKGRRKGKGKGRRRPETGDGSDGRGVRQKILAGWLANRISQIWFFFSRSRGGWWKTGKAPRVRMRPWVHHSQVAPADWDTVACVWGRVATRRWMRGPTGGAR